MNDQNNAIQNANDNADAGWRGRGRLDQLVSELKRQQETMVDFVADIRATTVKASPEGRLTLAARDPRSTTGEWLPSPLPLSKTALRQLAGDRIEPSVPGQFLDRLTGAHPDVAANLIDSLITRQRGQVVDNGKTRSIDNRAFVRILDGRVRAMLSNSYMVLDNYSLAFKVLEVARAKGAEVFECRLSDDKMTIKLIDRSLWEKVAEGQRRGEGHVWYGSKGNTAHLARLGQAGKDDGTDHTGIFHPSITISNSETGGGLLDVSIGLMESVCTNMVTIEKVIKRQHLGARLGEGMFRAETQRASSRAIMMQASDVIGAAFDRSKFEAMMGKVKGAAKDTIADPSSAVANLVKTEGLKDDEEKALLAHFLRDYNPNRLGLSSAVSRLAQDVQDPERADELETLAGQLLAV